MIKNYSANSVFESSCIVAIILIVVISLFPASAQGLFINVLRAILALAVVSALVSSFIGGRS